MYHYHGNDLDADNNPLEPEIVKHNQVAVLVYEPQFYAAPIRGFKLVLKRIQIVQKIPVSNKRKRDDETAIETSGAIACNSPNTSSAAGTFAVCEHT